MKKEEESIILGSKQRKLEFKRTQIPVNQKQQRDIQNEEW